MAQEQLNPEVLLQQANLTADGTLTDIQQVGGTGKTESKSGNLIV